MNPILASIRLFRTASLGGTLLAAPVAAQVCLEASSPFSPHLGASAATVADVDLDGHPDLITANSVLFGGCLRVYRGMGNGAFSEPELYHTISEPWIVRSADLNGDGFPDLVVAQYGEFISVSLNRGDGTFVPRTDYSLELGQADTIAFADFDGDGDVDIALGNLDWGWIRVLRNRGDGTFTPPGLPHMHQPVSELLATDVDGDGDADLVAIVPPGNVAVFLNPGNGVFSSPVVVPTQVWYPRRIASADFDADGLADIAVLGTYDSRNIVEVHLGLGGGSFGGPLAYLGPLESQIEPLQLAVADLDGDARPDLVALNESGWLSVLRNLGGGTFQPLARQASLPAACALAPADLDADGRLDLAVVSPWSIWTMRNEGGARFAAAPTTPVERNQGSPVSADFDGDGVPDVALLQYALYAESNGQVAILHNDGAGGLQPQQTLGAGRAPKQLVTGDFDGDGHPDLAVVDAFSLAEGWQSRVLVHLNHGGASFSQAPETGLHGYMRGFAAADIDQDGDSDLVLWESMPGPEWWGGVIVLRSRGDGSFDPPVLLSLPYWPLDARLADLDGDGAPDLALSRWSPGEGAVTLLRNQGDGTFVHWQSLGPETSGSTLACGDVDGNGTLDLVLGRGGWLPTRTLLNLGGGSFAAPIDSPASISAQDLQLCDLDGDGAPDLVGSDPAEGVVATLRNVGGGHFADERQFVAGISPAGVVTIDIDGDGDTDLLASNAAGLTTLRNCRPPWAVFCLGDGSGAPCPCANNGGIGRGCDNSAATGGAQLSVSGSASIALDTLGLHAAGELPTSSSVFLQGSVAIAPAPFGDGLRCVGGTLKRLYVHSASGGAVAAPQAGDSSVSARSAALGDPLSSGSVRHYQVYYRDSQLGFCPAPQGAGWNVSSGVSLTWRP